jgi:signal transduction histidine kinase/ActR/RegA family two-component response regulator
VALKAGEADMNLATRRELAECLAGVQSLIPFLVGSAMVMAIAMTPLLGWVPLPLMALWIAIQLSQRAWTARRLARGELEVRAGTGAVFLGASAAVLAILGIWAVASARPWTMVAGNFILASGLLFGAATTGRSRLASRAILIPNLIGLAVVPILAWRQGASLPQVLSTVTGMLLVAGTACRVRQQAHLALEAEHRANASKSEFLATVSHEIRTPLNGILGMAQAMAVDDLSSAQRQRLEMIGQSGETLLLLLNDLLDLSKIEAGKFELHETSFEPSALCASTHDTFEPLASQKGLELQVQIDPSARGRYLGDGPRVRQILFNLTSNAIKFSQQGVVRLQARRDGEVLVFSVFDKGVGICADDLARLFGAYEQLGAATAARHGGTGLGLAICRRLAAMMNGEISVESRIGEGSAFHLRLPLVRLCEDEPGASGPALSLEGLGRPLRVLAAEDNLVNQQVLRALLEPIGVDPVIVGDGAQALDAWRAHDWDVILMDVQMPVMNGLAAARAIRNEEAERGLTATPIIALTADVMAHQVERYAQAGIAHFVAKPVRIIDLYETLKAALGAGAVDSPRSAAAV